jgi:regulator of RNase E activity RraA
VTIPATTDLCDAHPEIQVCEPVFQIFGGNVRFAGPITTLKVFEDNTQLLSVSAGQNPAVCSDGTVMAHQASSTARRVRSSESGIRWP